MIAVLDELSAHVIHGIHTRVTYRKVTEAIENCSGGDHQETVFHSQLKMRTQLFGKTLQDFTAAIDHLAYCTHVVLFADGLRERHIRRQILLWGKKTLSDDLHQALELEATDSSRNTIQSLTNNNHNVLDRTNPPPPTERRDYG